MVQRLQLDGASVDNPFDLLRFSKREFRNYWFETGTPTFLIDLLTRRQAWLPELGKAQQQIRERGYAEK